MLMGKTESIEIQRLLVNQPQNAVAQYQQEQCNHYAERLNGSANEKFGLEKSLSVMPGDIVQLEVYAKYVDPISTHWTTALTTLMGQISSGTPGIVIDGANYSTSTGHISLII